MKTNNGYELSRRWFDFAFENSDAKCQHTALYLWIVELNNRLGWKEQFGLPTHATMEGLHIGNKSTYINALRDLAKWNFIQIVSESKNQYASTVVSLCRSKKVTAQVTALDTALIQQSNSIGMGSVPIDKQRNQETKKQRNQETIFRAPSENEVYNFLSQYITEKRLNWSDEKINTEASRFFNYYETVDWFRGKIKIKNWHSALRNWVSNNDKFEKEKSHTHGNSKATQREQQLNQFRQQVYTPDDQLRDIQQQLTIPRNT